MSIFERRLLFGEELLGKPTTQQGLVKGGLWFEQPPWAFLSVLVTVREV
jgi:hypothetical protein